MSKKQMAFKFLVKVKGSKNQFVLSPYGVANSCSSIIYFGQTHVFTSHQKFFARSECLIRVSDGIMFCASDVKNCVLGLFEVSEHQEGRTPASRYKYFKAARLLAICEPKEVSAESTGTKKVRFLWRLFDCDLEVMKVALSLPSGISKHDGTAIARAAEKGEINIVSMFLKSSFVINALAFRFAAKGGHIEVISLLFGAIEESKIEEYAVAALRASIHNGQLRMVDFLLTEWRSYVNLKIISHSSPELLEGVVKRDDSKMLACLLRHVSITRSKVKDLFLLAVLHNKLNVVRILNQATQELIGDALLIAVDKKLLEAADLLVESGASLSPDHREILDSLRKERRKESSFRVSSRQYTDLYFVRHGLCSSFKS